MEPGEPYWTCHLMHGQSPETYCRACVRIDWTRGFKELPPQVRALAEAKRPSRRAR